MKKLAVAASVLLLTGCSLVPSETDSKACEAFLNFNSADRVLTGVLDRQGFAETLRTDVQPQADGELSTKISDLATELEKEQLEVAKVATIAGEIAVRCAVAGVPLEVGNLTSLIG